jgi:hypothetical protein
MTRGIIVNCHGGRRLNTCTRCPYEPVGKRMLALRIEAIANTIPELRLSPTKGPAISTRETTVANLPTYYNHNHDLYTNHDLILLYRHAALLRSPPFPHVRLYTHAPTQIYTRTGRPHARRKGEDTHV